MAKTTFEFTVHGHPNVLSEHKSTVEFTKESELTLKGDCILGVSASKSLSDMPDEMKDLIRSGAKVKIKISLGDISEIIIAEGDPALSLDHPEDMVIRTSSHTDDRTLAINADKAAKDIRRDLVERLKSGNAVASVEISI